MRKLYVQLMYMNLNKDEEFPIIRFITSSLSDWIKKNPTHLTPIQGRLFIYPSYLSIYNTTVYSTVHLKKCLQNIKKKNLTDKLPEVKLFMCYPHYELANEMKKKKTKKNIFYSVPNFDHFYKLLTIYVAKRILIFEFVFYVLI